MHENNQKSKLKCLLIVFSVSLVVFALFSLKTTFHDTSEYISIAKYFAGVDNVNLFSTHSLLYPAFISIFLKIWPSFAMIKLVNCLWLFLISLILFFWLKNYKAFVLFAFSPLVWIVSIQTTPILPASLFFLLAWIFLKKTNLSYNWIYSGIFLGLSCAIYDVAILVVVIFLACYFFNKKLNEFMFYSFFIFIGFVPRLIFDFYMFNMPFYSLIRFFGANAIFSLGLSGYSNFQAFTNLKSIAALVVISPFLFELYKLAKNNRQDFIFLCISFVILLLRTGALKYFLIIAPIMLICLSAELSNKKIKWHCVISLLLILFFTLNYFTFELDSLAKSDLDKIINETNADYIVSGPFEADYLSTFLWTPSPKIVWFENYQASLQNKTIIRNYNFEFNSDKIQLRDKLVISGRFERIGNQAYKNPIIVSQNKNLTGFKLNKCYNVLCLYEES